MLLLALVVVLWVVPIFVAGRFTMERGRGRVPGALLGGFLGWIGVAIAACLSPIGASPFRATSVPERRCPFCIEPVHPDATVCPHCQRDIEKVS